MADTQPYEAKHVPLEDMEPSLNEVQQVDDYAQVIPVKVCEPVEARELPTKRIAPRTVVVSATVGANLLSADPRRKFATIIGRTQDLYLGATQAQAQASAAWIPGVLPLVVSSTAELWAMADGSTTDVTVIEEYWA